MDVLADGEVPAFWDMLKGQWIFCLNGNEFWTQPPQEVDAGSREAVPIAQHGIHHRAKESDVRRLCVRVR